MDTTEFKSKSDEHYKTLEAHRGWHKCRGQNCDEVKRLRAIWNEACKREEKLSINGGRESR